MFVQGKGNLLDCVREYDPNLTGKYLRIRGDDPELLAKAQAFLDQHQHVLIRSNATCEDLIVGGRAVTFAGLFHSETPGIHGVEKILTLIGAPHDFAAGNDQTNRRLAQILIQGKGVGTYLMPKVVWKQAMKGDLLALTPTSPQHRGNLPTEHHFTLDNMLEWAQFIRKYAQHRGIDLSNSRMDYIIHEKHRGNLTIVAEHPNVAEHWFVDYMIEKKENRDQLILDDQGNCWFGDKRYFADESCVPAVRRTINALRAAGKLSEDLSYVCEVISGDTPRIVQVRSYFPRILGSEPREDMYFSVSPGEELSFDRIGHGSEPDNTYPYDGLSLVALSQDEIKLPGDIRTGRPTRLLCMSFPKILSHQGLVHAETAHSVWADFEGRGLLMIGDQQLHLRFDDGNPYLTPT